MMWVGFLGIVREAGLGCMGPAPHVPAPHVPRPPVTWNTFLSPSNPCPPTNTHLDLCECYRMNLTKHECNPLSQPLRPSWRPRLRRRLTPAAAAWTLRTRRQAT